MCGRFTLSDATIRKVIELVDEVEENIERDIEGNRFNHDIYPSNIAPVILKQEKHSLFPMIWGYPHFKNTGIIFNARRETVLKKRIFHNGVRHNRVVIPTTSFYEWDRNKRKHEFYRRDGNVLYLAGIYDEFDGERRFIILTTDANGSMEKIHNRMPLILEQDEIFRWIEEDSSMETFLRKVPVELIYEDREPQQIMFK